MYTSPKARYTFNDIQPYRADDIPSLSAWIKKSESISFRIFWRRARDFVPRCRAIASLRSLPRRRKGFPEAFSSASLPPCSNPLFLNLTKNNNGTKRYRYHFWRRARDSNPRSRFSDLHDFQSCSFDQLGQLSINLFCFFVCFIIQQGRGKINTFSSIFLRHFKEKPPRLRWSLTGADDEARTRYLHLGKVALYQMSYIRIFWCLRSESNQRHTDFQSVALPTELQRRVRIFILSWRPGTGSNRRPLA